MKRTLLFIACVLTSITMMAQGSSNGYRPLVVEGKHWTYDNFMPLRPAEYDHYYYYELKGDTLIAGKKCLKMYSDNLSNTPTINYQAALYEENKKVYCFFSGTDEAILLYDFDCEVGDTIQINYPYKEQLLVKDIWTEDNDGIAIKKYNLQIIWDYEEEYVLWIEGVGAMKDFFAMIPASGNYNSLNACELNCEKLYQTIEPDLTEEGYHKMAIEGKRWNYIHYYLDEDGEHRDPYSYVVKGDTVIRRSTYKKLWYQDDKTERLVCLLLEQGRECLKSVDFGDNSYDTPLMSLFFDFGRKDFGRVFTWKAVNDSGNTNWMVYGVDTIEVNNQPFRRYTCLQKYSKEGEELSTIAYEGEGVWHDIWIEGVGSASSGIEKQNPLAEPPLRTPGEYTYFVSCYENGKCIFTADDFKVRPGTKLADNMAYRPFIEEGKVWQVGDYSGNPVRRVEYYYFEGDTIIDGKACKQMMRQRYVNPDHPDYAVISQLPSLSYMGAWYEEDKKVYQYDSANHQFKLMYDFSLNANDTLWVNKDYPPYVVRPRQTGGINGFKGVYRDVMMCGEGENTYNTTWLEGVGGIDGPMVRVYYGKEGHAIFLMACAVGDELIYFNDEYEDGATLDVIGAGARKQRIDFTHTIKIKPKARSKQEESDACISSSERDVARPKVKTRTEVKTRSEEGQSLYGEYNERKLDINLDPLSDAYQVCITDESGNAVYEKAINAGNIVGLNIDISSYPKGHYTVTVENDNESFVGKFETQTAGIEAVRSKKLETGGFIYNLQGQRLRSLQKGLNIVNGKKVYVK